MKLRQIKKHNYALAGVIEALLLVALVAIILATIQLMYVPMIMEEKEAEHMDLVANQYSQIKSVIEIQSMMGISSSSEPLAYSPTSSPITLWGEKLPYFVSMASMGQLNIIDEEATGSSLINIQPASTDFPNGIPLTLIKATLSYYYLDIPGDYYFVLEGGGVILRQPSRDGTAESMRVLPAITVEDQTTSVKINWNIPLFVSKPGKNVSGLKHCYIRTNYTKHYTHTDNSITFIHIYTDYLKAWNMSLIKDDSGILYEPYDNGYINVNFDDPQDPTRIEITPGTKNIDVELTIVEIGVQVGPGFVAE